MSERNEAQIFKQFQNIGVWESRAGQRAPNKPLLLLFMLGQAAHGQPRLQLYSNLESTLKKLLVDFGPQRKHVSALYPFWYLKNDGFWELANTDQLKFRKNKSEPLVSELKKYEVKGGFKKSVFSALTQNSHLLSRVATYLLETHFAQSLHEDILQSVGLELTETEVGGKSRRDPEFRQKIMTAYEHRCAVCGLDLRLDGHAVGIEAAHIKWHQAGGPDTENNGLALCALHHKLFDRGAFTIGLDFRILVSEKTSEGNRNSDAILKYHGKVMNIPIRKSYCPAKRYISWHHKEVMRWPKRELVP
jgi:putative restriction endonuclease